MKTCSRALVISISLPALAACSGAPAPPPLGPAAPAAVAVVPSPKLSLLADEPAAPEAPPPAPAEPLPPLTRRFEPVALPPDVSEIRAVAGRSARDVWMLTGRGDLLHWDGAKVTKEKGPTCRPPAGEDSVAGISYGRLTLLPGEVVASGKGQVRIFDNNFTVMVEARSRGSGSWSCATFGRAAYETRSKGPRTFALGASLLRFTAFAAAEDLPLVLDDRRLPLPDSAGYSSSVFGLLDRSPRTPDHLERAELEARAADDLWLYDTSSGAVLHGNGVGWEARPTGLARVSDLWVDDSGIAWAAGDGAVVRWDHVAHAWRRLPAPTNLQADLVRGSGRDVWFMGKSAIHQWDGQMLRRGATPLAGVSDAWAGPDGELWVVGRAPARRVKTGATEVPAGAAFRALAAPPPAPPAPPQPVDGAARSNATGREPQPPAPKRADSASASPVIADERGVTMEAPDHTPRWSVALRLFPAPVRSLAARKVAMDASGAVLTGASDGSLVGLDPDGKPHFQLGVRGAVSSIEAGPSGAFAVTTTTGVVVVGADGTVRSDSTAYPAPPRAKPTLAYRVERSGPPKAPAFTEVRAALALAPHDVWAIIKGEHVHHYDGRTWDAYGSSAVRFAKPVDNSLPLFVDGMARSPKGELLVLGTVHIPRPAFPTWAAPARAGVLERAGRGFRERLDISAAAHADDADNAAGRAVRYAASAGGREILCVKAHCQSRRLPHGARPGWGAGPPSSADEARWSSFQWPLESWPTPPRPLVFAGETLWAGDLVQGHGQLLRNGKVVLERLASGPLPPIKALFARGEDDVWALGGSDVWSEDAELLIHWDGKTFTSTEPPVKPVIGLWASARDDVWLAGPKGVVRFDGQQWWRIAGIEGDVSFITGTGGGDLWIGGASGLWHITPNPDARPDLQGSEAQPPPAAAPSAPLSIAPGGPSFRLHRVVLEVDGGEPLRTALGIAEGPGGVLWLHDGHRVVEHDGSKTRLLHATLPSEPLSCQRCVAPSGGGDGALLAPHLRGVTAGRISANLASLPALQALARSPSGSLWAVSAGSDDSLPHAFTTGPQGLRILSGLPAAAYSDVVARADDDVWMAGGLDASPSDGVRTWPQGEGTLVHFDGRRFTRHRAPDGALLAVAATAPGEAWAVGVAGSVVHAKVGTVEAHRLNRPVILRAVAAGAEDVWIAGDGSTLLRWDGRALQRVEASVAGADAAFTVVIAPVGAKPGWVAGPSGIWRVVRTP